jgi:hypothetical protein
MPLNYRILRRQGNFEGKIEGMGAKPGKDQVPTLECNKNTALKSPQTPLHKSFKVRQDIELIVK